jgi:hypothetical protein
MWDENYGWEVCFFWESGWMRIVGEKYVRGFRMDANYGWEARKRIRIGSNYGWEVCKRTRMDQVMDDKYVWMDEEHVWELGWDVKDGWEACSRIRMDEKRWMRSISRIRTWIRSKFEN